MLNSNEEQLYERLFYREEELRELRYQSEDKDIFIKDLVNENELLKAQVYNLSLYLKTLWNNVNSQWAVTVAMDFYDGMPGWVGFKEEVLESEDTV